MLFCWFFEYFLDCVEIFFIIDRYIRVSVWCDVIFEGVFYFVLFVLRLVIGVIVCVWVYFCVCYFEKVRKLWCGLLLVLGMNGWSFVCILCFGDGFYLWYYLFVCNFVFFYCFFDILVDECVSEFVFVWYIYFVFFLFVVVKVLI